MAKKDEAPDAAGDDREAKKGKLLPVLLAVVGMAAGGAAGLFVVGPAIAGPSDGAGVEASDAGGAHGEPEDDGRSGGHGEPAGGSQGGGHGGSSGSEELLHVIESLVVNPRGSGGSRFLLLDLAIQAVDDAMLSALEGRESEIRDRLLLALGNYTVDELADIQMREPLKEQLRIVLGDVLGRTVHTVFLPRYVIQ